MALIRRIARPLLAAPFILEGVRTALTPERDIDVFPEAFEAVDSAITKTSAPSFVDARTIVRASGAVAAGAGLLYATNRAPRLAAVTLLCTTTVGWAGRKRVWELSGEERTAEIQSILTDAGLLGGLLLAAVDHDGRPSMGYRWDQFVKRSQKNAEKKKTQLEKKRAQLEKKAGRLNSQARSTVEDAQKKLSSSLA
ncbi:DoxX family membrane protein [Brachybacterium timonense]|uniref:DoxX family membrane protein n=1 Tax=Brachybacterium timonense TaxID=2050896 RepID=UPI000D0ABE3D|nr:DoxX family membrane protein [Brachybacterium timonense]